MRGWVTRREADAHHLILRPVRLAPFGAFFVSVACVSRLHIYVFEPFATYVKRLIREDIERARH